MHAPVKPSPNPPQRFRGAGLALRLALRDLRAGLRGFGIFIACLALGVMTIAAVASASRGLTEGLAREGRRILGGDAAFSLIHREATPQELAFLTARGTVSSIATMRGMANAGVKGAALVEIKAVDSAYPSLGSVETEPQAALPGLLEQRDGLYGAVADPVLFGRLDLKPGDIVTVGGARLQLRANLVSEPDKIAAGVGFGPRLLMSQEALKATGLIQPGSLIRWTYRLQLPQTAASDADLERLVTDVGTQQRDAGWEIRSRANAAPSFQRNLERFTQFLTLVGLTALLVGGVGVANAVRRFVEAKKLDFATMKAVGATGGYVVAIHLTEVMLVAAIGTGIGLALGAAAPFGLGAIIQSILPVPFEPTLAPGELAIAALYGLLTALVFAIIPLGRAHDIPVSALFRDRIEPDPRLPRPVYLVLCALALAGLAGVAIGFAYDRRIALIYIGVMFGVFLLLRAVSLGLMALARRIPRPRRPALRMALANSHRPGALTPSLVLSLGLGVALLSALSFIDVSLTRQLTGALPEKAPSFFFLDIPSRESARFDAFLAEQRPGAKTERVPMMRGRIVAVNDTRAEDIKASEQSAWVLDGDRGITYAATVPEGSRVSFGEWWPADYRGEPLVSFDAQNAAGIGLKIGDRLTVNVLGRTITARVANLRTVDWRSFGINFVMVFSPNTFTGAPHTNLATVTASPDGSGATDAALMRRLALDFPAVTAVRVKDALEAVNTIVTQLAMAIRGASGLAIAASLLVLGGALAAGQRARLYDAMILKTLGATRRFILSSYAFEYAAIGLVAAVFGVIAGTAAGWGIVTQVMRIEFVSDPIGAILAATAAVAVTVLFGLVGTIKILAKAPASYLRNL
ncbi:glycosyl transferase family 1 [Bosea thiooxidans]|uniref:Glycosyl transferase family 1 n=1 Tax=Bosea thiooxidans TaxID=53254 RepID=A0A0Q3HZ02_9HYPH|nr:FtsX-like permease family protein [Bosea thiooxidans]KQK27976.1 glycosyl transferase family 1 [Bosea thiooxidans]SKC16069.1 putative ABC transport system permease protein [Bosea thiooxidans]